MIKSCIYLIYLSSDGSNLPLKIAEVKLPHFNFARRSFYYILLSLNLIHNKLINAPSNYNWWLAILILSFLHFSCLEITSQVTVRHKFLKFVQQFIKTASTNTYSYIVHQAIFARK